MNKLHLEALAELMRHGGVVAASDWTSGHGQHARRRTIPNGCAVLMADARVRGGAGDTLKGEVREAWQRLMIRRPRVRMVVAVVDLDFRTRVLLAEREGRRLLK